MPSLEPATEARAREKARELNIVGQWLREQSASTQPVYADAIGYPISLATGAMRDTSTLRHGATWLRWCESTGTTLLEAARADVLDWLDAVEATSLSKASKAHMLAAVSSFYRWCVEEGHLTTLSPVQVNRKKRGLSTTHDESRTRSLTLPEVAAIQHAADTDRITAQQLRSAAIVAVLFDVGLRVSELTGLTLADMAVMQGKRVLWLNLKGNRQHVVELPTGAVLRLDRYLDTRQDIERRPALAGEVSAGSPPLFATATGRPIHRSEVLRLLKRLARQAGLEQPDQIHPHVARHSWITTARENGEDSRAIQEYVGHLSESTTARYGKHALRVGNGIAERVARAYERHTSDLGYKEEIE